MQYPLLKHKAYNLSKGIERSKPFNELTRLKNSTIIKLDLIQFLQAPPTPRVMFYVSDIVILITSVAMQYNTK